MSVYGKLYNQYKDDPYIQAINEAFVGKSDTLLEIEKAIRDLRNSRSLSYYKDINVSKEVLAINRLFEKQFGMKLFALKIYKTDVPNGYTNVFALNFDVASNYDVTQWVEATAKGGYRFKDGNPFCVNVNMASCLFTDKQYTDAEIVAIMLHEIGHNFADCLYDKIRFQNIDLAYKYKDYYKQEALYALFYGHFIEAYKAYKEYKKFNSVNYTGKVETKEQKRWAKPISAIFQGLAAKVDDFKNYIGELLTRSLLGREYANAINRATSSKKAIAANTDSIDKQNEVFADKFAGVYGYGPEQASSLYKMTMWRTKADLKLDGNPANEAINRAFLKIHKIDCHPQLVQRAREELKLLEREIAKDDVDPRLKKVMEDQIDQLYKIIEDMCDQYSKLTKDAKMKAAYNDLINNEDPDAISKVLEDAIEASLDKLIDEDKAKNKNK